MKQNYQTVMETLPSENWLNTDEGKTWLNTDEGKEWLESNQNVLNEWSSSWLNANSVIKETYSNTIESIFDTGAYLANYASESWELMKKRQSEYLDGVDRVYEVNKLELSWQEKINKTSQKAQEKLNNLMEEELNYLREKDRLTEHDLQMAEARFKILEAQIALEDAQANKTKMRLKLDASGNYSYQYVADENDILSK